MPQIEPEYEEIPSFMNISEKLIERFPEEFGNIDLSRIACVGITNKTRSESKTKIFDVKTVKSPVRDFCSKDYIVVFYMHDWDELGQRYRSAITADVLFCIPSEGKGDLVPMDYKDHGVMLRTLGVDYMDSTSIPDLLNDNIVWKRSPGDVL